MILGATRQSRTTDKSVSLKAQNDAIEAYAAGQPVTITEDASTSGGSSCFDRPSLGPALKAGGFHTIVATKLDRLCRDTSDYMRLRQWCAARNVRIILLNQPQLDDTTPAGKAMATLLAVFAEFERDMARERSRDRYAAMASTGRWPGGVAPFGWTPVKDGNGYVLAPDEGGTADIVHDMARWAAEGDSYLKIAQRLNALGIKTTRAKEGRSWIPKTVKDVLMGAYTKRLLSQEEYEAMYTGLESRAQPNQGEHESGKHMLLRVLFCYDCQRPMYGREIKDRSDRYTCMKCNLSVTKKTAEDFLERELRARWAGREYEKKKTIPGASHNAEIRQLERQLEIARGIPGVDASGLEKMIADLKAKPGEPDREVYVPQGITIAAHWDSLDGAERGDFLRSSDVGMLAVRDSDGRVQLSVPATFDATARGWMDSLRNGE